jgi:hypothetical protein
MSLIETAYSSHKKCFICGRKENLKQVKRESIFYCLKNFNILIKNHARSCSRHIDQYGFIKEHEYMNIPTKSCALTDDIKNLMNVLTIKNHSGVFDIFNDITNVSEYFCKKITGWTRSEFSKFTKYITSINDTNGRTKEQLVAVYRYWLRKGLDQTSLAMFKNNTSQNQISHYLAQIRKAINKDFVPFHLGSKKNRDFFLEHNNITTSELHGMSKNQLAVFVDATYNRIEKSSNNDFQYKSWSMQKMDLLIKPFIICCADGYFIDCYGPFQANQNDAQIFDYILQTDKDLHMILKKNETILFLDRGREILKYFKLIFQKLKLF